MNVAGMRQALDSFRRMRKAYAAWPLIAASMLACGDDSSPHGKPLDDAGEPLCWRQLDVLFVIDRSVAKTLVHDRLSVALPAFLSGLGSGDFDRDGKAELIPFTDIHVGVVTSDLGGFVEGDKHCSATGQDGLLLDKSLSGECLGEAYPYQIYVPSDESKPDALIQRTQCLASVGLERCAYQQPLEAMYKALAPTSVGFHGGSTGHGDAENQGFLRPEAVLAVVHLSDGDDCSVTDEGALLYAEDPTDPRVLSPDSGKPLGSGLRCALAASQPGLLHPVSRFVEGLKALKPEHPERIVFAVIAGIPVSAEGQPAESLLARPELSPTPKLPEAADGVDSDPLAFDQTQLVPACEDPVGMVTGAPAPRLVQAAGGFGDNGVVRSVCADGYEAALAAVAGRISVGLEDCQCDPQRATSDAGSCAPVRP
jgi:hypothetical protein